MCRLVWTLDSPTAGSGCWDDRHTPTTTPDYDVVYLRCICFYLMCMRIYVYMYVYTPCDAWYPRRPEEVIRVPGTGVTNNFELSCGC